MAVSRIAQAGGKSTGTAVTVSCNAATSDTSTFAVVFVAISVSSSSTATTCTVTYGGTVMTQAQLTLLGTTTSRSALGVYWLRNPATGAQNVIATPGGASTKSGCEVSVAVYNGIDPAFTPTLSEAASRTLSPPSANYGMTVAGTINGAIMSTPTRTQVYNDGASVLGVGDYLLVQEATGTGSTISFSCTATDTTPDTIGFSLGPYIASGAAQAVTVGRTAAGAVATTSGANTAVAVTPTATGTMAATGGANLAITVTRTAAGTGPVTHAGDFFFL